MRRADQEERTGSFARWQAITIAQLTVAIDVSLGFAGASLAFGVNLAIKDSFQPVRWTGWAFLAALVVLLLSMGLGVWCVINRLLDFRVTTRAAKMREAGVPPAEIAPLRGEYARLGNRTWTLFWWQIGAFLVGVFLMVISAIGLVSSRLFCPPAV